MSAAKSLRLYGKGGKSVCLVSAECLSQSLQELKDTCGIQYDTDSFFVDYQIAGANLLPDITVIER